MGQANDSHRKILRQSYILHPPSRCVGACCSRPLSVVYTAGAWCEPPCARSARGVTTLFLISMADDDDWDTDPTFENNMTEAERRRAGERAMWEHRPEAPANSPPSTLAPVVPDQPGLQSLI